MVRLMATYFLIPFVLMSAMLGTFDARELAKLPNIVEHYQHHRTQHGQPDMSFFDFLASHFQPGAAHDDEHNNLPLFGGSASVWIMVPIIEVQTDVQHLFHIVVRPAHWFDTNLTATGTVSTVFQPPRLV